MTISIKHKFRSAKEDGIDSTEVQPSNWNDEHTLALDTGKLLGRTSAGNGAVEEVSPSAKLALAGGTLDIAAGAIENANMAPMPANTIKVNATDTGAPPTDIALAAKQLLGRGSSGGITPVTLGAGLKMTGATLDVNDFPPGVPIGAVFFFAGNAAPSGYLELNGAIVLRAAYAALWAYAQTSGNLAADDGAWQAGQFSPGNGTTTFRLPDLRGEFVRGWDNGRGVDAGRALGSAQADAFKTHTHNVSASPGGANGGSRPDQGNGGPTTTTTTLTTTSTGGTETRPRNIALLACIKY